MRPFLPLLESADGSLPFFRNEPFTNDIFMTFLWHSAPAFAALHLQKIPFLALGGLDLSFTVHELSSNKRNILAREKLRAVIFIRGS